MVRLAGEAPGTAGGRAGQEARKLKPEESRWRRAVAAPGMTRQVDLPAAIGHLRRGQRKRDFGELDHIIAISVDCQQQIAAEFRAALGRFPDGLALAQPPARRGEISGRQRMGRAAGDAKQESERQQRVGNQRRTRRLDGRRNRKVRVQTFSALRYGFSFRGLLAPKKMRGTIGKTRCILTRRKKYSRRQRKAHPPSNSPASTALTAEGRS